MDENEEMQEQVDDVFEVPLQLVQKFDATIIDKGDGTAEIRLKNKGVDLVKCTLPSMDGGEGILDGLFEKAREFIKYPDRMPKRSGFGDDTLQTRESVVAILRGPDGKRKN